MTRHVDTVKDAESQPEVEQPYADLGLKPDEYERIRDILGRRPTSSELAMYSVMWSEHCSYKSSKVHLRQFGEKVPARRRTSCWSASARTPESSTSVTVSPVTFKIESHNHPSYVEPYQGAATGIGGIVRDILTMGARPVAVMDPLRFGPADAPDTHRVLPGVVAGIGGYGNCLGLPNIGGEVVFDDSYLGNPLVNALCVGVVPHDRIQLSAATGAGNHVILFGAKTGGDGIGGVSVLASETFDDSDDSSGPSKRPERAGGRPVRREGAHRGLPGALRAAAGRRHPGSRRAPGSRARLARWRPTVTAACTSGSTASRCATPRSLPRRSS